jgi:hypothetical protein
MCRTLSGLTLSCAIHVLQLKNTCELNTIIYVKQVCIVKDWFVKKAIT